MVCRSSFRYRTKIKFYIATVGESEDAKKIANIEAEINAFVGEHTLRLRAKL